MWPDDTGNFNFNIGSGTGSSESQYQGQYGNQSLGVGSSESQYLIPGAQPWWQQASGLMGQGAANLGGSLAGLYGQATPQVMGNYSNLLNAGLGAVGAYGQQYQTQARQATDKLEAAQQQSLADRGLGNTTVGDSMKTGDEQALQLQSENIGSNQAQLGIGVLGSLGLPGAGEAASLAQNQINQQYGIGAQNLANQQALLGQYGGMVGQQGINRGTQTQAQQQAGTQSGSSANQWQNQSAQGSGTGGNTFNIYGGQGGAGGAGGTGTGGNATATGGGTQLGPPGAGYPGGNNPTGVGTGGGAFGPGGPGSPGGAGGAGGGGGQILPGPPGAGFPGGNGPGGWTGGDNPQQIPGGGGLPPVNPGGPGVILPGQGGSPAPGQGGGPPSDWQGPYGSGGYTPDPYAGGAGGGGGVGGGSYGGFQRETPNAGMDTGGGGPPPAETQGGLGAGGGSSMSALQPGAQGPNMTGKGGCVGPGCFSPAPGAQPGQRPSPGMVEQAGRPTGRGGPGYGGNRPGSILPPPRGGLGGGSGNIRYGGGVPVEQAGRPMGGTRPMPPQGFGEGYGGQGWGGYGPGMGVLNRNPPPGYGPGTGRGPQQGQGPGWRFQGESWTNTPTQPTGHPPNDSNVPYAQTGINQSGYIRYAPGAGQTRWGGIF